MRQVSRRRFDPSVHPILHEKAAEYLINGRDERFMITSFAVQHDKRDRIPAVMHVDGTARPQMVTRESNPRYHALISAFGDLTGEYAMLNTSFNVKGEADRLPSARGDPVLLRYRPR